MMFAIDNNLDGWQPNMNNGKIIKDRIPRDLYDIMELFVKSKEEITDEFPYFRVNRIIDKQLLWGCVNNHLDMVETLIVDFGANIHVVGDWALTSAARSGYSNIVKLLILNGADVNATNQLALRLAIQNGHFEIIELFIKLGIEIHDINRLLNLAAEKGYGKIVKLLKDNGADIHAEDDWILRWAAGMGRKAVVELLIENGSNIHACDDHPLRWAAGESQKKK